MTVIIKRKTYEDLASVIRNKTGATSLLSPADFKNIAITQEKPPIVKLLPSGKYAVTITSDDILNNGNPGTGPFRKNDVIEELNIVASGKTANFVQYFAQEADFKKVKIAGIKIISTEAFADCRVLESVEICEPCTQVGSRAFMDSNLNYSLQSVVLPNTVQIIDSESFSYAAIKEIVLPSNLQTIGEFAFADDIYLEKVTFPDTSFSIGTQAFMNCSNLGKIFLPSTATIEGDADYPQFDNCEKLEIYTVATSKPSTWNDAFACISSLDGTTATVHYGVSREQFNLITT
jgi:hypothetical protein